MITSQDVQNRLEKLRLARGWTEGELASRLGINKPWYYDMVLGEEGIYTELNLSQFFQLCRILDVMPVELISGESNFDPTATGLPIQLKYRLEEGIDKELHAKLQDTSLEDIIGEYFFTVAELGRYFEITDLMSIDWRGALMADYRRWEQVQPQNSCHWPDYFNYPPPSI